MMDVEKNISVNIPAEFQTKIDSGEYVLRGSQLRDKRGRIVRNLEALEAPESLHFSPKIFISFEQYSFVSVAAVPQSLKLELNSARQQMLSLEHKLDTLLLRQTNEISSAIANFNEHFLSLGEQSKLTNEGTAFSAGVAVASLLATNIGSYINEYLDSTDVWVGQDWKEVSYADFRKKDTTYYNPSISKSKFKRFKQHDANFFVYSFLDVLNNLNILSIVYDGKVYPRYEINLVALEDKLRSLLRKLVGGLDKEKDIFTMMYETDSADRYMSVDIACILKYDSSFSLHDLLLRNYQRRVSVDRDMDRLDSIMDVITLLKEIENLRLRGASLDSINLIGSPDVVALKESIFGNGLDHL
ncbi:hypothetical protein [Pseudomonas antarctica]|uniref:hypothetical protein n=1 Tax=Pseudomonas antarctica TaxID=219572 RepID=UPI00345DCA52